MIVEFPVSNFKSYKEPVSLSFRACDNEAPSNHVSCVRLKDGSVLRLVNSLAILGSNSSGKSNILWALQCLHLMVTQSRSFDDRHQIPYYLPYSFDETSKHNPMEMKLELIADGRRYSYAIRYTATETLLEELKMFNNDMTIPIFKVEREQDNKGRITIGKGFQGIGLETFYGRLLPNQLLLSELGTCCAEGLEEVYGAVSDIRIRMVNNIIDFDNWNRIAAEEILKDKNSNLFHQLVMMFQIADIGIDDIIMVRGGADEFSFPTGVLDHVKHTFIDQNKWEILMKHGQYSLDIRKESTGIKNLFAIGTLILDSLAKGSVLVVDDMNLAMHSVLLRFVVSLFHNPEINQYNAQLVFTTHDAFIANDNCMRADQVWFVEREENGVTQLFSLQDFEGIPITADFGNWYMAGRLGALPKFGDVKHILEGQS